MSDDVLSNADADVEPDCSEIESPSDNRDSTQGKVTWLPETAALSLIALVLLLLLGLGGRFGYQAYKGQQSDAQRQLFLQVGRQGAVNLTTIDYHHADADIQRILNSATGAFYDDFRSRSQPFTDVVKKAQAITVGTITEAALESDTGNDAQVLVAVSVKTSNAGAADQTPRAWRMRISVSKVGDDAKVSNVAFVPG